MNLTIVENKLRKIHGLGDGWHVCKWQVLGDPGIGTEFTFWQCPLVTRGERKGRPNWRKKTAERIVSASKQDGEKWTSEYETETGLCNECMGKGETFKSWSKNEGTTMQTCPRCGGSGKAVVK